MLYGLNDICIVPAKVSTINNRSECDPYSSGEMLPLFTAPMSCVINEKNWETFVQNGVFTVLPRNVNINKRIALCDSTFVALSLSEFEEWFVNKGKQTYGSKLFICIDIANGHMKKLIDLCIAAKEIQGEDLVLMTGNIANPETYLEYAKARIDYVRIGIGSGNVCTTSANGGVHYPMASLIQECVKIKNDIVEKKETIIKNANILEKQLEYSEFSNYHYDRSTELMIYKYKGYDKMSIPKIIADGGFKNFDHIIKALALGADYCMLGEIFAKAEEACGSIIRGGFGANHAPYREYYGMSTKRAQKEFGGEGNKTAEGIVKRVAIEYTLSKWTENFIHYLRTAMSYTNSRTLNEFHQCNTNIMSQQAFTSYNK